MQTPEIRTKWQPIAKSTKSMRQEVSRAIDELRHARKPREHYPGQAVGIRAPMVGETSLSGEEVQVWLRTRSEVRS
jgi:hypothetical protein